MREYFVTTNTDLTLAVPTLTVTVRAAFFCPKEVLPPADAGADPGRDTWVSAQAVNATFQLSTKPVGADRVVFHDVVQVGTTKPIQAAATERMTGIAYTDVAYSTAKDEKGNFLTGPRYQPAPGHQIPRKELSEARLPLFGVTQGDYLLKIIPPAAETTTPDAPASPATVIPTGGAASENKRTYRPLYVKLTFDEHLRLTKAVTVALQDGKVHDTVPQEVPGPGSVKHTVQRPVNHGYVTGHSEDELAVDLKPDVVRSVLQKARSAPIDMVVIHGTGGWIIGNDINTAQGGADNMNPLGPHYEVDRDGHLVKFINDDHVSWHAGPSNFFVKGHYADNVWNRSIGIEIINKVGSAFLEPQMLSLLVLLGQLKDAHAVPSQLFVGHVDVLVKRPGSPNALFMDDDRLTCPGREMDWGRLHDAGFGRPLSPKALDATDYAGFFTLGADDLKEAGKAANKWPLSLRSDDRDQGSQWGGLTWSDDAAKALLAKKHLDFKKIIHELQGDLKVIGYSVNEDGVYTARTSAAVRHFVGHTFSGPLKTLVAGGDGQQVSSLIAQYIKGTATAIRALP